MFLTEIVVTESLHNLWDEEERQFNWMLLQHPVGILQQLWVILVTPLKESDCDDRGHWCP